MRLIDLDLHLIELEMQMQFLNERKFFIILHLLPQNSIINWIEFTRHYHLIKDYNHKRSNKAMTFATTIFVINFGLKLLKLSRIKKNNMKQKVSLE